MGIPGSYRKLGIVGGVGGFAIIAILLVLRLAFPVRQATDAIVDAVAGRDEKPLDLTAVVTRVNQLSRLETAQMRVVHVSQIAQSYGIIPDMLAGDTLTLMAVGDVYAGVDLERLTSKDVYVASDGVVTMQLPPVQILVTRLDNQETKVISRKTGALRRQDIGLEGRARAYAENGIREEALHKGILNLASANAESKIAELLKTLGVERVRFERGGRHSIETPGR